MSLDGRHFRIAIVGGGPAGFYTATRLFTVPGGENVKVDLFELLPVPFGLSRFGVAPDHPEVKNCEHKFEQTARDPRFRFFGNVQVIDEKERPGSSSSATTSTLSPSQSVDSISAASLAAQIPLSSLKPYYDAVVFTYGASLDRSLGLVGEDDSENVLSARSFVNWYNGHPYFSSLISPTLDLSRVEHVTIIGQGNVALDVARILLKPLTWLKETDLPEYAFAELARSKVKRVDIVGRRGPLQLAATTKELREMLNLPDVGYEVDALEMQEAKELLNLHPTMENARAKSRGLHLLLTGSKSPFSQTGKSWSLKFLRTPTQFMPNERQRSAIASPGFPSGGLKEAKRVESVEYSVNKLRIPLDNAGETTDPAHYQAIPTGRMATTKTDMVFKSVGYRSTGLLGLPFDQKKGIVLNHHGRVKDTAGKIMKGLYTSGWVARGPTGVIATTMFDAFATADLIVEDLSYDEEHLPKCEAPIIALASHKRIVSWEDWEIIDKEERRRGASLGKPREKITSVTEMLKLLA